MLAKWVSNDRIVEILEDSNGLFAAHDEAKVFEEIRVNL